MLFACNKALPELSDEDSNVPAEDVNALEEVLDEMAAGDNDEEDEEDDSEDGNDEDGNEEDDIPYADEGNEG